MNSSITFNRHVIPVLSLFILLSLAACGKSGSSNDTIDEDFPEDDSSENDDTVLDSKDYLDSSAIGTVINSGMGTTSVTTDSINGYHTIRFGAYEWMSENVEEYVGTSTCYNDDEKNCNTYGSLFLNSVYNSSCPYGFHLPTVDDFKYLVNFAGNVTSKKFGFNPQYAGICRDTGKSIKCSEIGTTLNLMSSDRSYFHLSSSGKFEYAEMKNDEYYSVRCVRSSGFVDNENFLPTCNSQWEDERLFVSSEKTNYICRDKEWVKNNSSECHYSMRGQKHYINDTLYICDNKWRPAEMKDLDEPCSKANEWDVFKLNDINYVCEDTAWRKVEWPENKIGFCTPNSIGKIDSTLKDSVMTPYYCDTTGWRKATLIDVLGVCDSTKIYETGKYMKVGYVCRAQTSQELSWEKFTDLEKKIGACVPKNSGAKDTLVNEGDTVIYVCGYAKWRYAEPKDYHGDCDKAKLSKTVDFRGKTYVCRDNEKWLVLRSDEEDFGVCTSLQLGKRDTMYSSWAKDYTYYVCDTAAGWVDCPVGWRTAGIEDYYDCNESNMYKIVPFSEKYTYGCNEKLKWEPVYEPTASIGYCREEIRNTVKVATDNYSYICDSTWKIASIDEGLGECTAAREGERAFFNRVYYACKKGTWEKSDKLEYNFGVCDSSTLKKITLDEDSVHYICKSNGWSVAYTSDIFGTCEGDNLGRVVEIRTEKKVVEKRVCREKDEGWSKFTALEEIRGICTAKLEGDTIIYEDEVYKCTSYMWLDVPLDTTLGKCASSTYGNTGTIGTKKYICSANGWIPYDAVIDALGVCERSKVGTIKTYNGKNYGCGYNNYNSKNTYEWVQESEMTDSLGFCLGNKFEWKVYKGKDYSCYYDHDYWNNSSFWAMYFHCDEAQYGMTVGYEGHHFYCDEELTDSLEFYSGWHPVTHMDSTIGICRKEIHLEPATYLGEHYYCGTEKCGMYRDHCYTWLPATTLEQTYGQCDSKREGTKGKFNGMIFVCKDGLWMRAAEDYTTQKDSRSGQVFKSLKIGKHTWMAENLNYPVADHSWCPDGIPENCETYGRLYTWAAAMDVDLSYEMKSLSYSDTLSHKGICPEGWRIPAMSEWKELSETLDMDLGFSATSIGYQYVWFRNGIDRVEEYVATTKDTWYWSSSQESDSLAYMSYFSNKYESNQIKKKKQSGYPVRCIKDE